MPFMRLNVSAVGYLQCPGTCTSSTCPSELPLALCANYVGYPNNCGPTTSLQVPNGTDNSAFTSFFDPSTSNHDCRYFVDTPSAIPSVTVGQSINVTNGQDANCLQHIQDQFNLHKDASGKWCVFTAVLNCTGGSLNGAFTVAGFAQLCITQVVDTGSPKYVQGYLNCGVNVNNSSTPSAGGCFGSTVANSILAQ